MNATPQFSEKSCKSSHATSGCLVRAPLWRKSFYWFITKVYFHRITLIHGERLPKAGPVLYLGLHRNGAVDGFVYDRALRAPVFMISTQLRKNWFARVFFDGIAVTRAKDEGDRSLNDAALGRCLNHLRAGGELFVFPEGTSSLGPRHLPFKSGAIWLLLDYLERGGPPLQVIPLGVHYECPWAFRSKVEVVVGDPISTELPIEAGRLEKLKALKHRVQAALEQVGVNVPSDNYQEMINASLTSEPWELRDPISNCSRRWNEWRTRSYFNDGKRLSQRRNTLGCYCIKACRYFQSVRSRFIHSH